MISLLEWAWRFSRPRLPKRFRHLEHQTIPDCGLGIDALPDGLGYISCGTPVALLIKTQSDQIIWLRALLSDALHNGPAFLLAQDQDWVDQLLECKVLYSAYEKRQLKIYFVSAEFSQRVGRSGLAPAFFEMHKVGLGTTHALFVVGANDWLFNQSMLVLDRLVSELEHWCAQRQRPTVLAFFNASEPKELLLKLRNLSGLFHHIAVLTSDGGRSVLQLERWSGTNGAVFQSNYGLKMDDCTARLAYDGTLTRGPEQQLVEAPDQFKVVATRAAVANQTGVPNHWTIVASLSAVDAALVGSIAATVLLHAGAANEFEALARLVHHLRLTHPKSLKIVLRETQGKLRTNTEQALIRLGATVVVYREVGFSRLLQLLQDVNLQNYGTDVHPDYARALAAFIPNAVRGYLEPIRFCEVIQDTVERTSTVGLTHTIVQLHLLPHIAQLDALSACLMLRDGDLLTADRDCLMVFLFACREPDVDQALPRFFKQPLDQFFSSQVSESTEQGIGIMIDKLRAQIQDGLPDFSLALTAPMGEIKKIASLPHVDSSASPTPTDKVTEPEHVLKVALPVLSKLAVTGSSRVSVAPTMQQKPIAQRALKPQSAGNSG